jgi:zinc/manganese transport system substrate-binding protein
MRYLIATLLLIAAAPAAAELRILACEPEWAALAEAVGGDHVEVEAAIGPDQDAHRVQARPGLIASVRRADLVFCTGAGLEVGWLPVLLNRGGNPAVRQAPGLLLAAEQVDLLDKPETLDRSQGDMHAAGNPHIHLDPIRTAQVGLVLAERLAELDPPNATDYRKAAESLQTELTGLADELAQQGESLAGLPVVVHHRTWRYLLDWLGMVRVAELEPKPGLPPTPGHLSSLVARLKTVVPG